MAKTYEEEMLRLFLDDAWGKAGCGLIRRPPPSELRTSEWSLGFEELMRARLVMGALRYGSIGNVEKGGYDRIEYARRKLGTYEMTGNKEALVDVANLMLLEYEEGAGHFQGLDDSEHCAKRGE